MQSYTTGIGRWLQCSEMEPERNGNILIRASYATDYHIPVFPVLMSMHRRSSPWTGGERLFVQDMHPGCSIKLKRTRNF